MEYSIVIGYISFLLIAGSFIARIGEKMGLPDIPLLLLFGLFVGPVTGIVSSNYAQNIFAIVGTIGLIVLLLVGAFEMRWIVLKRVLKTVLKLDTVALFISLAISGVIFNMIFKLPHFNPVGYLYGAINCATDPATLIPIFSKSNIDPEIAITLEAESVFNDPLGIVATMLSLSALGLGESTNPILEFLALAIGGGILGLIAGKIFEIMVLKEDFNEYIAPLSIGAAMAVWYVGEELIPKVIGYEFSGFMAVAIMGLYLGNTLTKYPRKSNEIEKITEFCTDLSTLIRILIFVFLGASISLPFLKSYGFEGLLCAVGAIFIARPIAVFMATSIPPINETLKERLYLALEGPRGVVPAALAATVYSHIMANPNIIPSYIGKYIQPEAIAGSILVATFMTILLSVVIEGSWARPLADKLLK
ncbi:cation:proton antiporter [Methanotorris formicicus]|uniref:Sodium/hydrogen exchanger n=1 Tax=Methanotorris formicicus Mc-S-70 TaxID=647171 RepID=H1KY86_9EURY|nr:sodium:proton antiporter [Methanotorris formicicus]EHP87446.1 sodium/hydrogen exchanger [Methanotorris formicicus Mc-S-70]